jgi:hypothetical protein
MANFLLNNQGVVLIREEATYGTDAVNAALTSNANLQYIPVGDDFAMTLQQSESPPEILRPSWEGTAKQTIPDSTAISGTLPLTIGDPDPAWAPLLRAANFDRVDAGEYVLRTTQQPSCTIYHYRRQSHLVSAEDAWRLQYATGVRCGLRFSGEAQGFALAQLQGLGASWHDWTPARQYFDSDGEPRLRADGTSVSYTGDATFAPREAARCVGVTVTLGSTVYPAQSFVLDLASEQTPQRIVQGDPNVAHVVNTRPSADGSTIGEILLVDGAAAFEDFLTKWKADTSAALTIAVATAGHTLTFAMPAVQLLLGSPSAQGGILGFTIPFRAIGNPAHPFGENALTLDIAAV